MAQPARQESAASPSPQEGGVRRILRVAGPGIITGGADNDPSGIGTYSTVGATTGLSQLWLLIIAIPLLIAVQGVAARLGTVTKQGLAELIRAEFGKPIAIAAAILTVLANVTTIGADLVAMAAVLELITHIRLIYFIVPLAAVMGYITIFQNYKAMVKFLLWMVVVFFTYVLAGFLARPHWGTVLAQTVIPPIKPDITYFAGAVGLLGTTITPYLFFWQTGGEREERRGVERMGDTYIDISSGMVFTNFIAYFIVVSTASTLYVHHRSINTAADAAQALTPFAGHFASLLFAVGILGGGLMAIPVLSVSTGYVVAGTMGWREGLGRQAYSAPGFYAAIALSMLAGVELAISGVSPIKALFYSQILNGMISPILIALMVMLVSRPQLMGAYLASIWERIGGWAAVVIMALADAALIYSLIANRGA